MLRGGTVVIFINDMERAVQFYRDILGFKLLYQAGEHWAALDAGNGLMIGLHPKSEANPKPGTHGAISVGFQVTSPIADIVAILKARGVKFRGPIIQDAISIAFFADPDDNDLHIFEIPS